MKQKTKVMYIVYDTFDNDTVKFYGTSDEVAEYFKTTRKTIQSIVAKKLLRNKRYRIESIKLED